MVMTYTRMQKSRSKFCWFKTERKQTDGRTRPIALPSSLTRFVTSKLPGSAELLEFLLISRATTRGYGGHDHNIFVPGAILEMPIGLLNEVTGSHFVWKQNSRGSSRPKYLEGLGPSPDFPTLSPSSSPSPHLSLPIPSLRSRSIEYC